MPKQKSEKRSYTVDAKGKITKKTTEKPRSSAPDYRQEWLKRLRSRAALVKRGQATALGIQLVKNQLRTLNAGLKDQLLAKTPPTGFGTLTEQPSRDDELLDCLYELREMIVTLQFHLDMDDVTTLPITIPVSRTYAEWSFDQDSKGYYSLLSKKDQKVGEVALSGLVNRFSSAVFSDHHGLLIHARVNGKPDLKIYYQSLDATSQYSGSAAVRTSGGMLPYTGSISGASLRNAVGFAEQLSKLVIAEPGINVIILAEAGLQEANQLIAQSIDSSWIRHSNNTTKESGVNDITVIHAPSLAFNYTFSVENTGLGNAARIVCDPGTDSECTLLGCHILNSQAKNDKVGAFLKKGKVAALFGDTNMSTKSSSSLSHGFTTVEGSTSVTDSLTFDFSNSASNKMFDKLLVRKRP
ncbi:hypothetical protein HMI49_27550 [Corallococcus exercitus]|uniref:Uncharacterized protein n=1 Tax=Corallococcus exercitus TaxID=2316736 RepID=A0A7Y4NUK1_9BACT|nr:hypothetical protein [Corallococcus exercitus]NOK36966.1 hypothetical protein [Corallococcus exercitus]